MSDKTLYIAAIEAEMANYLEANPDASEAEAYEAASKPAFDRVADHYAEMIDAARERAKYGELS